MEEYYLERIEELTDTVLRLRQQLAEEKEANRELTDRLIEREGRLTNLQAWFRTMPSEVLTTLWTTPQE